MKSGRLEKIFKAYPFGKAFKYLQDGKYKDTRQQTSLMHSKVTEY